MDRLRRWSLRHAASMATLYAAFQKAAPRLAPLVAALGPARVGRWLLPVERAAKQALFNCRMCGQCGLSETGMACPMGCAKTMRNGPCGGVRADGGCEVRPSQRCTWVEATAGDERMQRGHTAGWWRRAAPLDHRQAGRSTWLPMMMPATPKPPPPQAVPVIAAVEAAADSFEAACRSGRFLITVELAPPDTPDPRGLIERAALFRGEVDAINITDGAGANCHMSSVAASSLLVAQGFEVVCQATCRDRNRIALQGDLLGAAALGIRNVLCLTGDDVGQGDHPQAKPVFDLDSVNLLDTLGGMVARGTFASGRRLEQAPRLFLGASVNPFVPPFAERVANLQRKVDAGARFIQTQFCFDLRRLEAFMQAVRERGLHRRATIIVGVGTLSSAKALRWMADHVPGVHVPDDVTRRIAAAADQRAEGRRLCLETIRAVRSIEGVAGVHLMGHRNEAVLADIAREVRAMDRAPQPRSAERPVFEPLR